MPLVLAGASHKSDSLDLRESLASLGAAEALRRLKAEGWGEAVVLSTCNRFEAYVADGEGEAAGRLASVIEGWSAPRSRSRLYLHSGAAAVTHLFSVASGLDSLVLGEGEILGQVKQAYEAAKAARMTGKLTNVLFQRALHVGKLVRSSTGISSGQMSVASVAVALAERIFGDLSASSVLILGAGKMAELSAKHLLSGKVSNLYVANRTWDNAVQLADKFKARPVRWEEFPAMLERVDVVIGSTGAPRPVVTREMVQEACRARKGRSLFFIDIAMPRDVEESVAGVDHAYLYALEDLQGIVRENVSRRQAEISAAKAVVEKKAEEFSSWLAQTSAGARASLPHSGKQVEA